MKPGRNDPCPCGSGKKYKKCCLAKDSGATPERNTWRLIQDGMHDLAQQLSRHLDQAYGDQALEEAWLAFTLWSDEDEREPFDPQLREADAFTNWLYFTWAPDPAETVVADATLHGVVPAQAYLAHHGDQLTPVLREYVRSCLDAPWSFFRVEQVDAGRDFTLRDLVTSMAHRIYVPQAGNTLRIGDETYGFLVTVAGVHLIGSLQPVDFLAHEMEALTVLRERTASQATDTTPEALAAELRGRDDEVRELYLLLTEMLPDPIMLTSGPSDPDEFAFHDLVFDIDSPQQAWDALRHVQSGDSESTVLERDGADHVRRASLLWRDPDGAPDDPEEAALGTIDIEDTMLTVQTSGDHASLAKDLIKDALGAHARLRDEDMQDIDSVLESMADDPELMAALDAEDIEEAYEDLRHVYTAWMDMQLPQLDERTPRQCVETPDGRTQVAALLDAAQVDAQDDLSAERSRELFDDIRQQLGLLD